MDGAKLVPYEIHPCLSADARLIVFYLFTAYRKPFHGLEADRLFSTSSNEEPLKIPYVP
jgi:hypothetical protein